MKSEIHSSPSNPFQMQSRGLAWPSNTFEWYCFTTDQFLLHSSYENFTTIGITFLVPGGVLAFPQICQTRSYLRVFASAILLPTPRPAQAPRQPDVTGHRG